MGSGYYVLEGETFRQVEVQEYLAWKKEQNRLDELGHANGRRIGWDEVDGLYRVSTVFLGIDHGFGENDVVLFETMVFPVDGWAELYGQRYRTIQEARAGHALSVRYTRVLVTPEGQAAYRIGGWEAVEAMLDAQEAVRGGDSA